MTTRSKARPVALTVVSDFFQTEPLTVKEALTSVWVTAMQEEYQALQQQNTWDLVSLPPNKVAIGCKWVFRIKRNLDGSVA